MAQSVVFEGVLILLLIAIRAHDRNKALFDSALDPHFADCQKVVVDVNGLKVVNGVDDLALADQKLTVTFSEQRLGLHNECTDSVLIQSA